MDMGSTDQPPPPKTDPTHTDLGAQGRQAAALLDRDRLPAESAKEPPPELSDKEKRARFDEWRKRNAVEHREKDERAGDLRDGEDARRDQRKDEQKDEDRRRAKRDEEAAERAKRAEKAARKLEREERDEDDDEGDEEGEGDLGADSDAGRGGRGDEDADESDDADKDEEHEDEPRDPQTRRRLNKAIQAAKRIGLDDEALRKMTQRDILALGKGASKLISERDDFRRQAIEAAKARGDSRQLAKERPAGEPAETPFDLDDLVSAFTEKDFDEQTRGAVRGLAQKVATSTTSLLQGMAGHYDQQLQTMSDVVSDFMYEATRHQLLVRYPQLENDVTAEKHHRATRRFLKSGEYDSIRSLPARTRAAAEDAARSLKLGERGANDDRDDSKLRNGTPDTRSKDRTRPQSELARKFAAWKGVNNGMRPAEARARAGLE